MRVFYPLIALAILALPLGCANPCEELADTTCEHTGAASKECAAIQDKAANPSPEEKKSCRIALDLVGDLAKVR